MSSNGKTLWLFSDTSLVSLLVFHVSEDCNDLYVVQPQMDLLTGLYFLFCWQMHFHIFVLHIFSLNFFFSFFVLFFFFLNLRGSNPTAISKMSIIVSLKKL